MIPDTYRYKHLTFIYKIQDSAWSDPMPARFRGHLRWSMVFDFKEALECIDHPFHLLLGILMGRPEIDDDLLADLSLPGSNTFDQVKRPVSLVAAFSGSRSEIHDATICYQDILSTKIWII